MFQKEFQKSVAYLSHYHEEQLFTSLSGLVS